MIYLNNIFSRFLLTHLSSLFQVLLVASHRMFPPRWPITFLQSVHPSGLPWLLAWVHPQAPHLWSPSPQLKQSMDFGGLKDVRYDRKLHFSPCLLALSSSIYARIFLKVDKSNYMIYPLKISHRKQKIIHLMCIICFSLCYMSAKMFLWEVQKRGRTMKLSSILFRPKPMIKKGSPYLLRCFGVLIS